MAFQPKVEDKNRPNDVASASDPAFTDTQGRHCEGALKIDATCADAEVCYPNDID